MREAEQIDLMQFKERLVGLEFENPLVREDGTIIDKKDLQKFWETFIKKGDQPDIDYLTNILVGAKKKLKNGSFEALNTDTGICILEMSLSPQPDLHQAKKVFEEVLISVIKTARKTKLRLLGYATQPRKITGETKNYKSDKSLYTAFSHIRRHNVMIPVCAHQTGVSVKLDELIRATNMLQALSGAVVCLIANSPIFEEKVTPWKELRLFSWQLFSTSGRTKAEMRAFAQTPKKPFKSVADYLKYIWASPMILPALRNGQWVKPKKTITWLDFFQKKRWSARDFYDKEVLLEPTISDINLAAISYWLDAKPHLTVSSEKATVEGFVKALEKDRLENYLNDKLLNCYIEYRIGGTAPIGEEMALPALTLGLINNLEDAETLVKQYKWKDWFNLRQTSYITAMETEFMGESILTLLSKIVDIAEIGLKKRKLKEEGYLLPLRKRIAEGKIPADKDIEIFEKKGLSGFLNSVTYR
jgi:gamma-glutamylcysteine synthetase